MADAFPTASAPAELDALSPARRARSQAGSALRADAEREVERTRYAAASARRQLDRVDPDDRLVAAEPERRRECALMEVGAAEAALARRSAPRPASRDAMGEAPESKVVALAGRPPRIRADPATTDAPRKALPRRLVEKVVLDRGTRDIAPARIVRRGGAVTDLDVKMRLNSVASRGAEMRDRVLELARAGMPDGEIAAALAHEGRRSPDSADKASPITIQRIRPAAGIKVAARRNKWRHAPDLLSADEVAARLGIPVDWLYVQIRKGRLLIDRQASGAHLFPNSPSALDAVRSLRDHAIPSLDVRINQPDKEGHQHG